MQALSLIGAQRVEERDKEREKERESEIGRERKKEREWQRWRERIGADKGKGRMKEADRHSPIRIY